jgi:L-cystine transport system substrate-binding protein
MNKKSVFFLSVLLVVASATIMANGQAAGAASGTGKPTEIIIGAGSAFNPYWFLDEKNQLTGFEKAVLDEIDSRLPQYTFKYQIYDFANILLSLESGKIDVAVHQYEYNIERDQKYLYGKQGYTTFPLILVVREDDDTIKSINDLKGKKVVSTSTTGNSYYVLNKWNEEHGKPFEIIFAATTALALEDIAAGRADSMTMLVRNVETYKEQYQAKIKPVGEPISNSDTYYLFNRQTGQELQRIFDEQLAALKRDGTLLRLSNQWLGGDYIPKN